MARRGASDGRHPTIQITASLPGAYPQTMLSWAVISLDWQFGEISRLHQMTSSAGTGTMQITCESLSAGRSNAPSDVQTASNASPGQFSKTLPAPPIYRNTNPAGVPNLLIALRSKTLSLAKVSNYASIVVGHKTQMAGVLLLTIGGEQNNAIRVQVNPAQVSTLK